jgi:hypothetical protein
VRNRERYGQSYQTGLGNSFRIGNFVNPPPNTTDTTSRSPARTHTRVSITRQHGTPEAQPPRDYRFNRHAARHAPAHAAGRAYHYRGGQQPLQCRASRRQTNSRTVWIKRGSFVVVDTSAMADRENKLDGEIVNIVRDEKAWRKMAYWYV